MQPLSRNGLDPARPVAQRRDPAPSRVAYRLHRLWLTPVFRILMRVGVPVFLLSVSVGIYFSDPDRRLSAQARYEAILSSIKDRPEFMVNSLEITNASAPLADAVRNVAAVPFPISSWDLDLEALRADVERIDAVKAADVMVGAGGVLQIRITEREPAIIWRSRTGLFLLDPTGHRIAELTSREAQPELPLIAGLGADTNVPEALALIDAARPIEARLRGLVRMGERRWDLVLDRGQRIQLPQEQPVQALERVIALDKAEDILARDVTVVDMRNMNRPTLRLTDDALARFQGASPERLQASAPAVEAD